MKKKLTEVLIRNKIKDNLLLVLAEKTLQE